MISKGLWFYFYSFLFLAGILALGYVVPRTSFYPSLTVYSGLFFLYWRLCRLSCSGKELKKLLALAVILRLALLSSIPQWSDDYARFVWDGQILVEGHSPYLFTPAEAREQWDFKHKTFMEQLFPMLNSPDYHSVYPPGNQLVFGFAAALADGNLTYAIMLIRLVLLGFELLAFYFLNRLLSLMHQPEKKILLYALNPLVIMEVTGNLHFEGMMLAMILAAIYFLMKNKYVLSGGFLGAAVGVKLSPLLLIPPFIKQISGRNLWVFIGGIGTVIFLGFFPLIPDALPGFWKSLSLYGNNFEFNASIYYILRGMGYWIFGYNIIGILGPLLKVLTLVLILYVSFTAKHRNMETFIGTLLGLYWVYFLLNTVVHPWYILPALALSILTEKKAFLAWSFLIFLSYHAYKNSVYTESPWLISLEYAGVFGFLYLDYKRIGIRSH